MLRRTQGVGLPDIQTQARAPRPLVTAWGTRRTLPSAILSGEHAPAHHICVVGTNVLGHIARNLHSDGKLLPNQNSGISCASFPHFLDG